MKNTIIKVSKLLFLCLLCSCSKWTEPEAKQIDQIGGHNVGSKESISDYYKELRAWKSAVGNYTRPISFGWFSNWNPTGVVRKGYLSALPDSIDMISMWSGTFGINEEQKRDKAYVQQVKGTKILVCKLLYNIGDQITPPEVTEKVIAENPNLSENERSQKVRKAIEHYWGFTSGVAGSEDHLEAIRRYARALSDTIVKYDYDGYDLDWEPAGGGFGKGNLMGGDGKYILEFIKEMGRYMGPKATEDTGKRRYLVVDGELSRLPQEVGAYVDYFISQAYGNSYLEGRIESASRHFGPYYDIRKHIFTENFESYAIHGGALLEQAAFKSKLGSKGGVGAFRLDNDYDNQPDYKWMRQAIQQMLKTHDEQTKPQPNN